MAISYEWDHETSDEHGDIDDHDFSDSLKMSGFDHSMLYQKGNDLVLVRNEGDQWEGLTDRFWAYARVAEDGKLYLPDHFNQGTGYEMPNMKVPQRFHKELARWQK